MESVFLDGADPAGRQRARVTLDIVIPIYNEAAVLPALLEELSRAFSAEARAQHGLAQVNCLFVDDGSSDAGVAIVRGAPPRGLGVTVLRFSRNFGHQAAVSAGVAHARADLVAVMDADLQDPPGCILEMLEKWRSGFEVVYGQRRNRKEGVAKRVLYAAFYRLYRALSPISVPIDSGDFCLMSRRVVEQLNRLPESLRFPRGLRSWVGFPQAAIRYDRPARAAGESRYSWRDLYQLATDGIAALSLRPLKLAQFLALLYLLLSVGAVTGLLLNVFADVDLRAQLLIILLIMLSSNALILLCLYILGAYLGRAYVEIKGRPGYIVAETLVVAPPGGAGAEARE